MRSPCTDCTRKHLAAGEALMGKFIETGLSLYRFLAAGEIEQAEAEIAEISMDFAKKIRVVRCTIIKSDRDGRQVYEDHLLWTLIEEATVIGKETGVDLEQHAFDMAQLPTVDKGSLTMMEEVILHLAIAVAYQKETFMGYPWYVRLAKGELTRAAS